MTITSYVRLMLLSQRQVTCQALSPSGARFSRRVPPSACGSWELHRLDRYRLALDARKSDPRTVDTLIRISERVAKLHGLDAPQRIEASGPNGGPIETEEKRDYSKLTLDEMLQLDALLRKSMGHPTADEEHHVIGGGPYSREWYAAQRAAETQPTPALTAGS